MSAFARLGRLGQQIAKPNALGGVTSCRGFAAEASHGSGSKMKTSIYIILFTVAPLIFVVQSSFNLTGGQTPYPRRDKAN